MAGESRGSLNFLISVIETLMWHVYILKCSDESFYVGHTESLPERVLMHNARRAAKWTACRLPVVLVYSELCESEEIAMIRERQIKRWSHAKKKALISGDMKMLHNLARRKLTSSL
jgi:predicted GIY-YIG superfamily endonuclease